MSSYFACSGGSCHRRYMALGFILKKNNDWFLWSADDMEEVPSSASCANFLFTLKPNIILGSS